MPTPKDDWETCPECGQKYDPLDAEQFAVHLHGERSTVEAVAGVSLDPAALRGIVGVRVGERWKCLGCGAVVVFPDTEPEPAGCASCGAKGLVAL